MSQVSGGCGTACDIELTRLVTLSDAGHPGILPIQSIYVTSDRAGHYLVVSREAKQIVVFDRTGRIVRIVDGDGSSPFALVSNILTAPDGLLRVYDSARLFMLNADFRVVGTAPARYRPALLLDGGRYLVAEQIPTPELVGQPLHVVAADGVVVRSFGAAQAAFRADEPRKYRRVVAPSSDGTIWSAAPGRYALERWDPSIGLRKDSIAVQSTWFKESLRQPRQGERPSPVILAIWDADGYLWALLQDADSNWRPSAAPMAERSFDADEHDRVYDYILEAIDRRSGRIVASKRFDGALWGRAPSFLLAGRRQSTGARAALVRVDVWQPRLVRKETRQ